MLVLPTEGEMFELMYTLSQQLLANIFMNIFFFYLAYTENMLNGFSL